MSALGGDLVIGADDQGSSTGEVDDRQLELLDEARLSTKLGRYLPSGTSLRTAVHEVDGRAVVLVAVAPHPDGLCVFAADGSHDDKTVFRAGDVFVRRGTRSVRWSNDDARAFIQRTRNGQREQVRIEIGAEWEAARTTTAPEAPRGARAPTAHWAMDLDAFVEAVLDHLRARDDIPLRRLLVGLPRELATYSRGTRGIERTADTLDRVAALLAQSVVIEHGDIFDAVLRRLVATYETAVSNPAPGAAVPAPVLGLMLLERVYPVGALVVREGRYDLVRQLAAGRLRDRSDRHTPYWLAEIQRSAERHDFMRTVDPTRPPHTWVISRATECAERNLWLVPDVLPDDERVVTSLCEFGDDAALAEALITLARTATSRWGTLIPPWDGYDDQRILAFLDEHGRSV